MQSTASFENTYDTNKSDQASSRPCATFKKVVKTLSRRLSGHGSRTFTFLSKSPPLSEAPLGSHVAPPDTCGGATIFPARHPAHQGPPTNKCGTVSDKRAAALSAHNQGEFKKPPCAPLQSPAVFYTLSVFFCCCSTSRRAADPPLGEGVTPLYW
jgi:hypothetical protein